MADDWGTEYAYVVKRISGGFKVSEQLVELPWLYKSQRPDFASARDRRTKEPVDAYATQLEAERAATRKAKVSHG